MQYWLFALTLAACGGLDRNIEDEITIEQGVYGQLISGCDTSGCQDQPAASERVIVYAAGQNEQSARSDAHGVYEISLEAGDYTLCTYSCTPITVPANDRIRVDWISGPGGGHWESQ